MKDPYWHRMTKAEIDAFYRKIEEGVAKYGLRFSRPASCSASEGKATPRAKARKRPVKPC